MRTKLIILPKKKYFILLIGSIQNDSGMNAGWPVFQPDLFYLNSSLKPILDTTLASLFNMFDRNSPKIA